MKTASFFILSASLHAAALASPVTFAARSPAVPIRVTIFPVELQSIGGSSSDPAATAPGVKPIARASARSDAAARFEPKPAVLAPQPVGATFEVATIDNSAVSWISPVAEPASAHADAFDKSPGGSPRGGGESTGTGVAGNGYDTGSGSSEGASRSGSAGNGVALIQARYRDTPRPHYPESARREGREGRVLLRVLIDDQGRTKSVEINTSSGNSVLDRAAAEAIQRWRFHPARYGDQPVEAWLRIPIEFRLADAKP